MKKRVRGSKKLHERTIKKDSKTATFGTDQRRDGPKDGHDLL